MDFKIVNDILTNNTDKLRLNRGQRSIIKMDMYKKLNIIMKRKF